MIVLKFCNVVAAESYDCSCKLADIIQYKYATLKQYLKTKKIKKELRAKMNHSNSYSEWKVHAEKYDNLTKIRLWKEYQESNQYDWAYIKHLTQTLCELRTTEDYVRLMHLIRSNSVRNIANVLNPSLYCKSYIGTKHLIEDFQKEMIACLDYLGNLQDDKLPRNKKLEFFAEIRHAFGRTAIIFSGGGNIGLYHHGVIKALYEENLLPRIVAGSSVGSIFATFFCVRTMDDVPFMLDPRNIKLGAFHRRNQKFSSMRKIARLFSEGYLLDVRVIRDFMRENIGDITFQEAYDKTGWILNITVTGYGEHDGYRLLNYLTAPNVLIWSAVCASCGIPYIYGPVDLYCKNENDEIIPYVSGNRKFVDGSLGADLPLQNLSEMFNVNYFIVSQTNFWVVPFLNHSEQHRYSKRTIFYRGWERIKDLVAAEIKHRVNQLAIMGIFPAAMSRYFNLITQQYSGHVTIWPDFTFNDLMTLLIGPTTEMLRNCIIRGSRRVYPKVNRITATLAIERALERNYFKARAMMERPVLLHEIIESDYDNKEDIREEASFISSDAIYETMNQNSLPQQTNKELLNSRCRVNSFNVPRSTSVYGMKHLVDLGMKDDFQTHKTLRSETEIKAEVDRLVK